MTPELNTAIIALVVSLTALAVQWYRIGHYVEIALKNPRLRAKIYDAFREEEKRRLAGMNGGVTPDLPEPPPYLHREY